MGSAAFGPWVRVGRIPTGRRYVIADDTGGLDVVDRETRELTELVGAFASPASTDFFDDDPPLTR